MRWEKMFLFHGTTYNKLMSILKDGYIGSEETIWNVSQPNTTYFWSLKEMSKDYDAHINSDDEVNAYNECVMKSLESAQLSLGSEVENLRRVVIMIDEEKLSRHGLIEEDNSCENMRNVVQFEGKIPVELIERVLIDKNKLDMFGAYFIGLSRYQNTWRKKGAGHIKLKESDEVPEHLKELAEKIYLESSEEWFENMYELDDLEEFTITKGEMKAEERK